MSPDTASEVGQSEERCQDFFEFNTSEPTYLFCLERLADFDHEDFSNGGSEQSQPRMPRVQAKVLPARQGAPWTRRAHSPKSG